MPLASKAASKASTLARAVVNGERSGHLRQRTGHLGYAEQLHKLAGGEVRRARHVESPQDCRIALQDEEGERVCHVEQHAVAFKCSKIALGRSVYLLESGWRQRCEGIEDGAVRGRRFVETSLPFKNIR